MAKNIDKMKKRLDKTVEYLKSIGFQLDNFKFNSFDKYNFESFDKIFYFRMFTRDVTLHISNYEYIENYCNNRTGYKVIIYIEHAELYNKMVRCPILLPLPVNKLQFNKLSDIIKFMGSEKGYDLSNDDLISNDGYDLVY